MKRVPLKRLSRVTVLAVIALLCVTGVASAKSFKAKAPIQSEKPFNCNTNYSELPVIGSVAFKRTGNLLDMKVKVMGLAPDTAYEVTLYLTNLGCPYFAAPIQFTTNAKGKGKGAGSTEVPAEATEFEADIVNVNTREEPGATPPVSLP
jgi:hypothetical protein